MMAELFQVCVDLLRDLSSYLGCTYEEINIIIFIILHPTITLHFILKYRKANKEFYKLREMYWKLKN